MGPELVTISAGGQRWSGFESIEFESAMDQAADSFCMTIAAQSGAVAAAQTFVPGSPLSIASNGDTVFTGFVDRYAPSMNGKRERSISVAGRGKSQDFIDGAAIHETGRFENQTLLQIAQALDQYGCGFTTDQTLDVIPEYQVTPGETAFDAIERLARKQGLALAGQPDGSIKITKAGTLRHAGGLYEGVNILSASADLNWAHRHSKIIVRGQKPDGSGAAATQIEATSEDEALGRNRPLVLVEDGDVDEDEAQERADMRRDREAGESLKASVTVQGFRDDAGAIWMPGKLVWLESPFLGLACLMLIKHRRCSQSRHGSTTDLTLVDPRAFGGKAGKGGSAGVAWSFDAGTAVTTSNIG